MEFMSEVRKLFTSHAKRKRRLGQAHSVLLVLDLTTHQHAPPFLTVDCSSLTVGLFCLAWIAFLAMDPSTVLSMESRPVFLAKVRGGTCTTAETDPPEAVIHRAIYLLVYGFGNYDLFGNNCEDFALYCKTGLVPIEDIRVGRSGQASQFIGMVGVPLAAIFSKLLTAGPLGMATVTAGMYWRYITDIGVRKDVVKVAVQDLCVKLGWKHCRTEQKAEEEGSDGEVVTLLPTEE